MSPFEGIDHIALAPHSKEAIASKEFWLNKPFFIARQAILVGLLIGLDFLYIRASLRPDLIAATRRLKDTGKDIPGWWGYFTGGAGALDAEVEASAKRQATLVPVLGFAFAIVFSLVAFDLIMSLSPWWFSNMFGGWFFVSSVWLSLCALGLVSMVGRDWLGLGEWVTPTVTHDLGKLLLAFCMFWAYTTYAQILPIWYTNMPEETDYLLVRMYLPQWSWLAKTVAVCCFLAPFTIMLSRGIKKMRWAFAGLCAFMMFGIFLERSLLVMPSVYFGDTFPTVDFLIVNIGVWIGMLGLLTTVIGRVLASTPAIAVTDPLIEQHPWDVHVHSLDATH